MIYQSLVHHLRPLQLFQLLYQGVVAQDGPGESQGVRGRRAHVLHHVMLQLLQNQVQVLALFGIGVKFVVFYCDFLLLVY